MIKNINQIINNLLEFYDFKDKVILSVGAGGGQLISYAKVAKKVIAVDNDKSALSMLEKRLRNNGLIDKFSFIHSDFKNVEQEADVVLFEFCLHEMKDPYAMIKHAKGIANSIVIMDHDINSKWAFIGDEKEKAIKSWEDVSKFIVLDKKTYCVTQYFNTYEELYDKIKIQGENSINRIKNFENQKDILIPMRYCLALI